MRRHSRLLLAGSVLLIGIVLSGRAEAQGLPRLTSLPGDPFSEAERQAVAAWTLARPEVAALFSGSRTRLLRMGSDLPRDGNGEYRRATLYFRNYDSGLTHAVSVNLRTAALEIRDLDGLVQPNQEEIEEGIAILARDPALSPFVSDRKLRLMGGFVNRSPYPDDPCSRDICLEYDFMKPGWRKGPTRRVIVNLSRKAVAHDDFRAATAGGPVPRMSDPRRERARTSNREGP